MMGKKRAKFKTKYVEDCYPARFTKSVGLACMWAPKHVEPDSEIPRWIGCHVMIFAWHTHTVAFVAMHWQSLN